MDRSVIIKAVDDYSTAVGLKPSTVCQYAIRNRNFYDNVKTGGNFGVATAERLLEWIEKQQPKR